jgi:hypothetical protein
MNHALCALIGLPLLAMFLYLAFIAAKMIELILKVGWETRPLIFFQPQSAICIIGLLFVLVVISGIKWLKNTSDFWHKLYGLVALVLLAAVVLGFVSFAFALTKQ